MTDTATAPSVTRCDIAAWILTGCALFTILSAHLLPALLAGLFVYELVNVLTKVIHLSRLTGYKARVVAVAFIAAVVVTLLSLMIFALIAFFRTGNEGLPVLLTRMADILDDCRRMLPDWLTDNLPDDADSMQYAVVELLKEHAAAVKLVGTAAIRILTYILVGMVVGGILSLREARATHEYKPLAGALVERASRLSIAFRRVVFAQMWIAAINAFFTWLYLGVALPLMGVHLPLTKTLIAITFIVGLLPVIGNLISNTVIVVVSLSHSLPVAIGSLAFLVVIHKLEYFLNAKIVGSRIRAHAWELLIAMLVMEAVFGLRGVIAAPIFYAYLKDELVERGII